MRITRRDERIFITVKPGEYYVSRDDVVISTLLGSCVSACLYDPAVKVIGMNHFLLSNRRYARKMPYYVTEAGRYGVHSMEVLINEMMKMGARRNHLRAKAFGGASLLHSSEDKENFACVGSVNARFIRAFLVHEGIPLISSDLGGDKGRVIRFHARDYSVYVRKIRKTVNPQLGLKEKRYWRKAIKSQEQKIVKPDIWD
jgi:chemotaxis protein CheD